MYQRQGTSRLMMNSLLAPAALHFPWRWPRQILKTLALKKSGTSFREELLDGLPNCEYFGISAHRCIDAPM
jgi:hypothetical protein